MAFFIILIIIVVILISCIKIVPQANAYVIEFLGSYQRTWTNGPHFKIPFFQRIAEKVSLKEQVADFPPQPVITKDNVTMQIDTVVYYQVYDPNLYCYGVENPVMALANLTATTLRNIIGELELDETLTSRDTVNSKMQSILDEATDKWGIKVNRVELKNIIPPQDIQQSMEKQMKAERERRQTLLEADAHREAVIKRAEGDKQAAILNAEADRDSAIARAEGNATAIKMKYDAEAQGLERLANANVNDVVIALRQLDTLKALGDGRATKLVVPTELTESASTLSYIGETLNITKDINLSPKKQKTTTKEDVCCDDDEKSDVTKSIVSDN